MCVRGQEPGVCTQNQDAPGHSTALHEPTYILDLTDILTLTTYTDIHM